MMHSHEWITDEILENLKYVNSRLDWSDRRLARIERKLFTKEDNLDYFLEEIKFYGLIRSDKSNS